MAEFTTKQYLDLAGLKVYDAEIKKYLAAADSAVDAKSIKKVLLDGDIIKFYKNADATKDDTADFEVEISSSDVQALLTKVGSTELAAYESQTDISGILNVLTGGNDVEGSVAKAKADAITAGQAAAGAVAADLLRVDTRLQTAEGEIDALQTDVATLKGEGIGSVKKAVSDAKTELKGDAATAQATDATIEGAKKFAEGKVSDLNDSLHAVAKSGSAADVEVASEKVNATTVAGALDELADAVSSANTQAVVTVEKEETDEASAYSAIYHIKQNGKKVGVPINIPKDMVVKSGEVKKNAAGKTVIELTLANNDGTKLEIPVDSLIEYVTGGATAEMTLSVDDNHVVTGVINDASIALGKLSTSVQASLGKADSAMQSVIISGHTLANGGTLTTEQLKEDLGLANAIAGVTTAYFEGTSDEALAGFAGMKQGDIAVIKKAIAGDKVEHTAYVYDNNTWKALDGNYNAKNVYFDGDLTYTAAIGVKTVPASGAGTIAAEGKSLDEVFKSILAVEKNPTVTQPTATIASTASKAYEVGTNASINYAITTNPGRYQYDSTTGVVFDNYAVTFEGQTLNTASGTFDAVQITDGMNSKVKATFTSSEGNVPKSNLGNPVESLKIAEKDWSLTNATAVTGYRSWFCGYKTGATALADPTTITSAQIRALGNNRNGSVLTPMQTNQMKQMFFAIPHSANKTSVTVADATNGAPQTVTKLGSTVMVEGANGYQAVEYDVWYVDNAAAANGGGKFNITVR